MRDNGLWWGDRICGSHLLLASLLGCAKLSVILDMVSVACCCCEP